LRVADQDDDSLERAYSEKDLITPNPEMERQGSQKSLRIS